jgi:hypothetical protein
VALAARVLMAPHALKAPRRQGASAVMATWLLGPRLDSRVCLLQPSQAASSWVPRVRPAP